MVMNIGAYLSLTVLRLTPILPFSRNQTIAIMLLQFEITMADWLKLDQNAYEVVLAQNWLK